MKTTEQILNLLTPLVKNGKSAKNLLTKGAGKDFKDILTSLDITDSEKAGIVFELLSQFKGKNDSNSTVKKSDILEAVKLLSGKYNKTTTAELSLEKDAKHPIQLTSVKKTTSGLQSGKLGVVAAKIPHNLNKTPLTQNILKATVFGQSKMKTAVKQSSVKLTESLDPLFKKNLIKDISLKTETRGISKAIFSKSNIIEDSLITKGAIKKFGIQINTANITSPVESNVTKDLIFKSGIENHTDVNTKPKIDQESLNNLAVASAEKALSKNSNEYAGTIEPKSVKKIEKDFGKISERGYGKPIESKVTNKVEFKIEQNDVKSSPITATEKNGIQKNIISDVDNRIVKSKPVSTIQGNLVPVEARSMESSELKEREMPIRLKGFSKGEGKGSNSQTVGKVSYANDHEVLNRTPNQREVLNKYNLKEGKVSIASTQKNQTEQLITNDNSFVKRGDNKLFSQNILVSAHINKGIKAFNLAGKRANTVSVKAKKISNKKSVNRSERIQTNKSEANLSMVQKSYGKQTELSNFEKERLNISGLMGEKIVTEFGSPERFENGLSKVKTNFFSNGVAINPEKMAAASQLKLSVKMINAELSKIQLRISPKGLGNITIDIQQEGKALYTKFVVQTAEVASILQDSLPELKETLAQQGLKMEETQISSKKDELEQQLTEKRENQLNERNNKDRSNLHQNIVSDIPLEILTQKSIRTLSPYSTVEYLA